MEVESNIFMGFYMNVFLPTLPPNPEKNKKKPQTQSEQLQKVLRMLSKCQSHFSYYLSDLCHHSPPDIEKKKLPLHSIPFHRPGT